jgi:hypothetical protein
MFTLLPGRNALGVGPERIIAIIESINAPNVALPDAGAEPTKAYLIGVLTPHGGASILCYLLQTQSNRPFCYLSTPTEVGLDSYAALEAESIQYVESMGFMLDNMNFRSRAPHDQAHLVETLPFFREQHPRPVASSPATPFPASFSTSFASSPGTPQSTPSGGTRGPAASQTDRAALGRLLASF